MCPVWFPDGRKLAFVGKSRAIRPNELDGQGYLVVLPAEGGPHQEFPIPTPQLRTVGLHDLRWVSNGKFIGFSSRNKKGEATLFRLELETGNWRTWALPIDGWTRIEWSREGDSYLYFRVGESPQNPGIIERDLNSGEERYIYRPDLPEGYGAGYRGLKFSRDYRKIVANEGIYPAEEPADGDEGSSHLLVVDVATGEFQRLASNQRFRGAGWSPDGKYLLASGPPLGKPGRKGLHLVPLDGSPTQRLTWGEDLPADTHFFSTIDWSPDGERITFSLRTMRFNIFLFKDLLGNGMQ